MPDAHFRHARLLHTMLRVRNLDRALAFYVGQLGMKLLRLQDFTRGRFTLAFVGYEAEDRASVIELTHNWDDRDYDPGDAFGHLAIEVEDLLAAADHLAARGVPIIRPPGPLDGDPSQRIAFIADPDGYRIELIERRSWPAPSPTLTAADAPAPVA